MDTKLYSLADVAEHFKVHPKTVQTWIRQGKLKGSKVGRRWYFTSEQVEAVLKGGGVKGDPNGGADNT